MTALYLMQMQPDLRRLLAWAARGRLVPEKGQGDLGYAFHAALTAAFGTLAPKPFSHRPGQGLLAYTSHTPEAWRTAVELATPELSAMLGLDRGPRSPGLLVRPFPTAWDIGQRLCFAVRVRPILRTASGPERDVFLATVEKAPGESHDRSEIYRHWLACQLEGAAQIEDAIISQFRLATLLRKGAPAASSGRGRRLVTGPDVVFSGRLRIQDSPVFVQKVARGLGRHRAFGFGMLLLRPVGP